MMGGPTFHLAFFLFGFGEHGVSEREKEKKKEKKEKKEKKMLQRFGPIVCSAHAAPLAEQVARCTRSFLQENLHFFLETPIATQHLANAWKAYHNEHNPYFKATKEWLSRTSSCSSPPLPPPSLEIPQWNRWSKIWEAGEKRSIWSRGLDTWDLPSVSMHPVAAVMVWCMYEQLVQYQMMSWEEWKPWFEGRSSATILAQERSWFAWNMRRYDHALAYTEVIERMHHMLDQKSNRHVSYVTSLVGSQPDVLQTLRMGGGGSVHIAVRPYQGVQSGLDTKHWNDRLFGDATFLLLKREDVKAMQDKLAVWKGTIQNEKSKEGEGIDASMVRRFLQRSQWEV
mmetsp:Transcript_9180/g.24868  ORF Transcript_9180/g.24868 Transcript_9180/m.24868 type:complete len:340 (-) Transcript_9180:1629-2648(-)